MFWLKNRTILAGSFGGVYIQEFSDYEPVHKFMLAVSPGLENIRNIRVSHCRPRTGPGTRHPAQDAVAGVPER